MGPIDDDGPAPAAGAIPLNIQIVSAYYAPETTGNAPYATSLAEGLARLGHHVGVVAAAPHYPGWSVRPRSEWMPDELANGVWVRRVKSYVPARPNFLKRLIYEVGFGIKFAVRAATDADVILLVSPSLFSSVVVRLRMGMGRRRPSLVLWMQDLYAVGVGETPGRAARLSSAAIRAVEGALARSCDQVVVIHGRFKDVVTQRLRIAPDRVEVIRNWTHVPTLLPADAGAVRARWTWATPGDVVVVHAGNMGAKQGLEHVVAAARAAESHALPVKFVLMGDGNQRSQLESLAAGCSHLKFIPPLPETEFLATLRAADVLLVNERPSLNEAAVPSKLTTYFSTGLPVLAATDAKSTTADEIRGSGAGAIASPADPDGLARAAISLARTWTDRDAKAGPAFVAEVLSQEAAIARFEEVLLCSVPGGTGTVGVTERTT